MKVQLILHMVNINISIYYIGLSSYVGCDRTIFTSFS